MSNICPVCGCEAEVHPIGPLNMETSVKCPTCGTFFVTEVAEDEMNRDEVAAWLFYHSKYDEKQKRYTSVYCISKDPIEKDGIRYVTLDEISNWYPKTFNEKIDKILLGLANKLEFLGNYKELTRNQIFSCFFIKRFNENSERLKDIVIYSQWNDILDYLKESEYIEESSVDNYSCNIKMLIKGWQRVDELQKNNSNNRNVFIAMSFDSKNDDTKKALKSGIINAQYVPRIMSEEIHGKQIVPMMFRIIRESQLLVMDISDPNYGAYYEAGYAQGLGKEVIISCKKDVFNKKYTTEEEKKFEKYLKPHFDIAQKQILLWEDYEDLTLKLSEWIKAIIG